MYFNGQQGVSYWLQKEVRKVFNSHNTHHCYLYCKLWPHLHKMALELGNLVTDNTQPIRIEMQHIFIEMCRSHWLPREPQLSLQWPLLSVCCWFAISCLSYTQSDTLFHNHEWWEKGRVFEEEGATPEERQCETERDHLWRWCGWTQRLSDRLRTQWSHIACTYFKGVTFHNNWSTWFSFCFSKHA